MCVCARAVMTSLDRPWTLPSSYSYPQVTNHPTPQTGNEVCSKKRNDACVFNVSKGEEKSIYGTRRDEWNAGNDNRNE